jgi:hypothetical protein
MTRHLLVPAAANPKPNTGNNNGPPLDLHQRLTAPDEIISEGDEPVIVVRAALPPCRSPIGRADRVRIFPDIVASQALRGSTFRENAASGVQEGPTGRRKGALLCW